MQIAVDGPGIAADRDQVRRMRKGRGNGAALASNIMKH
jgi:hypothetical protein